MITSINETKLKMKKYDVKLGNRINKNNPFKIKKSFDTVQLDHDLGIDE